MSTFFITDYTDYTDYTNQYDLCNSRNPCLFFEPGRTYHVYNHANGFENLFRCDRNYFYFLDKYAKYIYPIADTYAYCLMPNHLHFMIRVRSEETVLDFLKTKRKRADLQAFDKPGDFSLAISKQFSDLFNGYAQAYNKMYGRMGSLFIPNFKKKLVDTDEYFKSLLVYIHKNPVHHGFVSDLREWPYSSYMEYFNEKIARINIQPVLSYLGGIEEFEKLHITTKLNGNILHRLESYDF